MIRTLTEKTDTVAYTQAPTQADIYVGYLRPHTLPRTHAITYTTTYAHTHIRTHKDRCPPRVSFCHSLYLSIHPSPFSFSFSHRRQFLSRHPLYVVCLIATVQHRLCLFVRVALFINHRAIYTQHAPYLFLDIHTQHSTTLTKHNKPFKDRGTQVIGTQYA